MSLAFDHHRANGAPDTNPAVDTTPITVPALCGFPSGALFYRALEALWANRITKDAGDLLRWTFNPPSNSNSTRLVVQSIHRLLTDADYRPAFEYLSTVDTLTLQVSATELPGRTIHRDPRFQSERNLACELEAETACAFGFASLLAPQPELSMWVACRAHCLFETLEKLIGPEEKQRERQWAKALFAVNTCAFMALQSVFENFSDDTAKAVAGRWVTGGVFQAATCIADNITSSVAAAFFARSGDETFERLYEQIQSLATSDCCRFIDRLPRSREFQQAKHILYVASQSRAHVATAANVAADAFYFADDAAPAALDLEASRLVESALANAPSTFERLPAIPLYLAQLDRGLPILMGASGVDGLCVTYEGDAEGECVHRAKPWLERISALGSFDIANRYAVWMDRSCSVSNSLFDRFHPALDAASSPAHTELRRLGGMQLVILDKICSVLPELYRANGPVCIVVAPDRTSLYCCAEDVDTFQTLSDPVSNAKSIPFSEALSTFAPRGFPEMHEIPIDHIDLGINGACEECDESPVSRIKVAVGNKIPSYGEMIALLKPFGVYETDGNSGSHRYLRRALPGGGHEKVTMCQSIYGSTESLSVKLLLGLIRRFKIPPEDFLASVD